MLWIRCAACCAIVGISLSTWASDSGDAEDASAPDTVPQATTDQTQTSAAVESLAPPDAASRDETDARFEDPSSPPGFSKPQDPEEPWDFSPYRVLVWLVSDDPAVSVGSIEKPLRDYLDRDYAAIWRIHLADAPAAVRSAAFRDMGSLSYDLITAADPVLAVKRDHKEAVRIRTPKTVGQYVKRIYGTKGRIEETKRRAAALGDESIAGVSARLEATEGDAIAVRDLWADESTEALLVSRGLATTLTEPEAKLITPKLSGLVGKAVEVFDKIFIVHVRREKIPNKIDVVEFDSLMRHFGPVARVQAASAGSLPVDIGRGLSKAFAPVVRIENAGQRNAVGLLRAGGLIVDENSPASIRVGDVLEPMTRKNDRNGKPILIGAIDWAFLLVTELEGRNINMDYYAGRAGGLQGRQNKRTFRTALRVRPFGKSSLLRLHLQRNPEFPLIGYELYQKELKSTKMTFIGRTDWNGRLVIERTDEPFRLLYVKNGGAVLARLPLVPGLHKVDVADLSGDDMRLQAEAYIRGVQNAIIDLVAIRELFKARIRMRLEKGEMENAETLMIALREQPSNEKLAADMGKKQAVFLKALGTRNANQRRKVDEMFTTTRELLSKHINPKLVRDLEAMMIAARNNGGKLPPQEEESDEADEDVPPAAAPAGDAAGDAASEQ